MERNSVSMTEEGVGQGYGSSGQILPPPSLIQTLLLPGSTPELFHHALLPTLFQKHVILHKVRPSLPPGLCLCTRMVDPLQSGPFLYSLLYPSLSNNIPALQMLKEMDGNYLPLVGGLLTAGTSSDSSC